MNEAQPEDRLAEARRRMVDEQLVARGIYDQRVLASMRAAPRHLFVEPGMEGSAYGDYALPVSEGQTISQPWIVARMLELAELATNHRALEIGTGTGYQTYLLAGLVAHVYTVERLAPLLESARARLARLHVHNASYLLGDGTLGWQEHAPYARVLAAAAAPHVPNALLQQLQDEGVLVMPVGGAQSQHLEVWRRQGDRFTRERHGECRFVPLIGRDGWRDDPHHN